MRKVLALDATGLNALEDWHERLRARGWHIIASGPRAQPLFMMDKAGFLDRLGRDNARANIELSLTRARELLHWPPEETAVAGQAQITPTNSRAKFGQTFARRGEQAS